MSLWNAKQYFPDLKKQLRFWVIVGLAFLPIYLLLCFLSPKSGHGADIYCWLEWSKFIYEHRLGNVYQSFTNYLPLYHYILCFYGKIQGSIENIVANIHKLKFFTLAFEVGSTLLLFNLVYQKIKDPYKAFILSLFYLLNIAVLYNSIIWSQVDGILTFFVFASIVSGYYKHVFLSIVFMLLALNFKLQAVVFLPLVLLILLPLLLKKDFLKMGLLTLGGTLLIQTAIVWPFMRAGDLPKIWNVVTGLVDHAPVLSMNAYNMWFWLFDGDLAAIKDTGIWLIFSYKQWGLILFAATSMIALYPLIKSALQNIIHKNNVALPFDKILLSAALIPLLFFFFNTQMHERYSHSTLIFLAAYALLYKGYLAYTFGSIACFLNMESVFGYLKPYHNHNSFVYNPKFIACLFFITIILLFINLFDIRLTFKQKDINPS